MRILVATLHKLLCADVFTNEKWIIHEGHGPYYGISYDKEQIYVASRSAGGGRPAQILVFNYTLDQVGGFRPTEFVLADMHQIVRHADQLYVACAGHDRIAVFDFEVSSWHSLWPFGPRLNDEHHINSIYFDGTGMECFIAHRRPPGSKRHPCTQSKLFHIRESAGKLLLGVSAHNVWRVGGTTWWCDSGGGRIRSSEDHLVHTGDFPRGVAWTDEYRIIGLSQSVYNRADRITHDGEVVVFNADWDEVNRLRLGDCGPVNEIRIPGVPDLAHPEFVGEVPDPSQKRSV